MKPLSSGPILRRISQGLIHFAAPFFSFHVPIFPARCSRSPFLRPVFETPLLWYLSPPVEWSAHPVEWRPLFEMVRVLCSRSRPLFEARPSVHTPPGVLETQLCVRDPLFETSSSKTSLRVRDPLCLFETSCSRPPCSRTPFVRDTLFDTPWLFETSFVCSRPPIRDPLLFETPVFETPPLCLRPFVPEPLLFETPCSTPPWLFETSLYLFATSYSKPLFIRDPHIRNTNARNPI